LFAVLNEVSDGIVVACPDSGQLVMGNAQVAMWLGLPPNELVGRMVDDVIRLSGAPLLSVQLKSLTADRVVLIDARQKLQLPDGTSMGVDVRLRPIQIDRMSLVAIIMRPLGATAPSQPPTSFVAGRDPLTGLPDRSVLRARMEALLQGDRLADRQFAVLFIDLDNFKQVNDAHGHLIGDSVLQEVARRLSTCVRSSDLIVRFGGDEFVALVAGVAVYSEIQPVIERIAAALARPIALPEGEVRLSVSVGVAEASPAHQSPEHLLHEADQAMYASKRTGGG
jgi:diguanylate cyclase (GGDEF)-like protein